MAVNKVVMNTENGTQTLIDLTGDTVTPDTLAEGVTAHDASGAIITGTLSLGGNVETTAVTISTNSNRVWATVYEDGEVKTISEMAPLIGYKIPNAVCGSALMVRVINAVGSVEGATLVHEVGVTDDSGSHSWFSCYRVNGTTPEIPYVNLFVEADVQTNTRFNSSGEIVSGNFWCMSTYLQVTAGDVIRVYCPNGLWSNHGQRVICTYDSSKAHISKDFYVTNCTQSTDGHMITVTIPSGVAYIRISGLPATNTSGTIITKNEEIV